MHDIGANARAGAAHARWTPVLVVLLAVLLRAGHAGATVGLAEREAMYRYNTYSDLWWGHSDACSGGIAAFGKDCFRFEADTTQTLLHRVAMPDARAGRWMLAQEHEHGHWIIFDVTAGTRLVTGTRAAAERSWRGLGLTLPRMITADDTLFPLWETPSSWFANLPLRALASLCWLPWVLFPIVLAWWFLRRRARRGMRA